MGAYLTQTDLARRLTEEQLTQLTDDAGLGTADAAVVAVVIGEAEAEVDAYLGQRYPLPLATVPELVRRVAVEIALWNLFARRQAADEVVQSRYKEAVKLLERVAAGAVGLGLPVASTPAPAGGVATAATPGRVFTADTLKGF